MRRPSNAASAIIRARAAVAPDIAIILGSGLGSLADSVADSVAIPYGDLPGFPAPGVGGHAGRLILGRLGGKPVAVLQGRAHYYEQGDAGVMRPALEALAGAGCKMLILTNAAGSLRHEVGAGSLMLIADHINFTGINPLFGDDGGNARFVDMSGAYDADLGRRFRDTAKRLDIDLADGTYMWFTGPSFETPAEIRAARVLGADAVGMSTVPEVIIARRLGLRVAAVSNITNLAAGLAAEQPLSHERTLAKAGAGAAALGRLIVGVLEGL